MIVRGIAMALCAIGLACPLVGCAFNVISIHQVPVTLTAEPPGQKFRLVAETKVRLGEGFARALKRDTVWSKVGHLQQGDVYATNDQVVTVEASNEFEAEIVVKDGNIVGFYLLVEHTFTPAEKPVPFNVSPTS